MNDSTPDSRPLDSTPPPSAEQATSGSTNAGSENRATAVVMQPRPASHLVRKFLDVVSAITDCWSQIEATGRDGDHTIHRIEVEVIGANNATIFRECLRRMVLQYFQNIGRHVVPVDILLHEQQRMTAKGEVIFRGLKVVLFERIPDVVDDKTFIGVSIEGHTDEFGHQEWKLFSAATE